MIMTRVMMTIANDNDEGNDDDNDNDGYRQ